MAWQRKMIFKKDKLDSVRKGATRKERIRANM